MASFQCQAPEGGTKDGFAFQRVAKQGAAEAICQREGEYLWGGQNPFIGRSREWSDRFKRVQIR